MATKTLYFKNTTPNGASKFGALQEGATLTAVNQGGGWAVGTRAVGDFGPIAGPFTELANGSGLWTTSVLPSTSAPDDSVGDAYRSELPYYGEFANTDWSFSMVLRSTATNWDGRCKIGFRIFKGLAQDGSDATELTSTTVATAATTANLSTTTDRTVTATWSPGGTITLDGHYLFVKIALEVTTQGTNSGNARLRSGSTTSVATPDFTPATGPKQFWLKDAVPTGATNHRSLQDGGSAITAATTGTGWTAGTNANTLYCIQNGGSEIAAADGQWTSTAQPAAASLSTTIGDAWRSESALTCTFVNNNWGFQFAFRSVTANYAGRYQIRIRVYKSANQDGSSATELTSSALNSSTTVQNHATSLDTMATISWAPGSTLTFSNEYLFVQVAIDITTAGGGSTQDILHRVGSAAMIGVFTPNLAGDVTQALTGQSATASSGSLTVVEEIALTGAAATSAQGTLSASTAVDVALTGQSATASFGSLTVLEEIPLTGQTATAAHGSFTFGDVAIGLMGQSVTTAQGAFAPEIGLALAGFSSTASGGAMVPALAIPMAGQAASAVIGAMTPALTKGLTGQAATAAVGSPTATLSVTLAGQAGTAAYGGMGVTLTIPVQGQFVTAAFGTLSVSGVVQAALTGFSMATALGSMPVTVSVQLAGQAVTVETEAFVFPLQDSPRPSDYDLFSNATNSVALTLVVPITREMFAVVSTNDSFVVH